MSRDLAAAANRNLQTGIERLADAVPGGSTREFGPLTAAASGLPAPTFNRLFVFADAPEETLAEAVAWLDERRAPYWVTATDRTAGSLDPLVAAGTLDPASSQPGMALSTLADVSVPPTDATITEVTTDDEWTAFSDVSGSVFEMPEEAVADVESASRSVESVRGFLGYVAGEAVACGTLIRTGDVAGVYTIGVLPEYRRRGLGHALTATVLRAGRADGCEVGVLQSSEMAVPLYEAMGFETVVGYRLFSPAT